MLTNKVGKTLIILLLLIMVADTIDAQRRTRRSRQSRGDKQEQSKSELAQWYAISLGSTGFGSGFSISGKFSYALKYQDRVSLGAYGKILYDLVNLRNAPDVGLLSLGGGAFTRINVTNEIFVQGEYSYTNFEGLAQNFTDFKEDHIYPSIGGGYKSGYGDWTYGFHVLVPLNDRVRDFINLEYWIDFNYKF